jgi:hypothetical protein
MNTKKHPKSHGVADDTEKKLKGLSEDLDKLLAKHKLAGVKFTGIELRPHVDSIGPVQPEGTKLTDCVVLPDGSVWCG